MEDLKPVSTAQLPTVSTGVTALVEEDKDQQLTHKILIELIEDLKKRSD